jgi:hypothetical protein
MRREILALATTASLIAGCGSDYDTERGRGDAPVGKTFEDDRKVWQNVDQYPNISAFCIGNSGVYTTTREASPVIIADDSNCLPGGALFSEND